VKEIKDKIKKHNKEKTTKFTVLNKTYIHVFVYIWVSLFLNRKSNICILRYCCYVWI